MTGFFGGGNSGPSATPPPPPAPPPAANPPTYANPAVQGVGAAAARRARAAAGPFGGDGTILTSPQGAKAPPTAEKQLTGL
jgi:hypothetical protein